MRIFLGSAVLSFAMASSALAQTGASDQARIQFKQGVELYEEGKYEHAAVAFESAYQLNPSYKILFNIGQTQNELGHYAAALEAYRRYLDEGSDKLSGERKKSIQGDINRLSALVGTIVVKHSDSGTTVYVDGKRRGSTPLAEPIYVDMGDHEVLLKRGTRELHREVLRVMGGQRVELDVPTGSAVAEVKVTEEPRPQPDSPPAEKEPTKGKRLWTWVALGIGGAAAVGVGITGGLALSKTRDLESACENDQCPPAQQEEYDSAGKLVTAANVLTGVAAAGIAAGVILFFIEPGWHEEPVTVTPSASNEGFGLALSGRF